VKTAGYGMFWLKCTL